MGPRLTSREVSAGQFPAKFSFDSTSTRFATATLLPISWCSQRDQRHWYDSVGASSPTITSTGMRGFTIGPLIYWSYNTDGGTVITSPVLSADGTQLAFIAHGHSKFRSRRGPGDIKVGSACNKRCKRNHSGIYQHTVRQLPCLFGSVFDRLALSGAAPTDSLLSRTTIMPRCSLRWR